MRKVKRVLLRCRHFGNVIHCSCEVTAGNEEEPVYLVHSRWHLLLDADNFFNNIHTDMWVKQSTDHIKN